MKWYRIDYRDTDGETSSHYVRARTVIEARSLFADISRAKIVRCVLAPDYQPQ